MIESLLESKSLQILNNRMKINMIKGSKKEKKILKPNERKMMYSEENISAILKQYFHNKKNMEKQKDIDEYYINPNSINLELFEEQKSDFKQERTRKIILRAFGEVKKNPEKYAKPFKVVIPKRTWVSKTVVELKELAEKDGDHMANWVEQALEWAQRIANGESWKSVCNKPDSHESYRLITWENGFARLIGGSRENKDKSPATKVFFYDYSTFSKIFYGVPLVVIYN